jgi:hypothetical protein
MEGLGFSTFALPISCQKQLELFPTHFFDVVWLGIMDKLMVFSWYYAEALRKIST